MEQKINKDSYNSSSIKVLKGLSAVRLRPQMYVGNVDARGLQHLVRETVDNCIDEAMAGHCNHIEINIAADAETITIEDNGRGIPVDIHQEEGKSALEIVMTVLHAGGKFTSDDGENGKAAYVTSGGLHGVGISCVNALSSYLKARVWRDGGEYVQEYSEGIPKAPVTRVGDSKKHGTAITFRADPTIFLDGIKFDDNAMIRMLRELSFLLGGLKITYNNAFTGKFEIFQNNDGIIDYVKYLNAPRTSHYPAEPFYCENKSNNVDVKIALQYTSEDGETVLCFTNNIPNPEGGTHFSGFKTALTRVVNVFAKNLQLLKAGENNLSGDDIRDGISAVISVKIPQPQFESQTKIKLLSVDADSAVNSVLGEALTSYFEKNPAVIKLIIERAVMAQRIREAASKQRDLIKRQTFLGKSNRLPGKLKDCNSEDRTQTELFLVEGDSASGSASDGRNPEYQAILALRGKIINAEKTDLESLLKNNEIQSLISSIGAGIEIGGEDVSNFNLENIRYNKIVILCDADVDGSHIATLLLTFFYKFMRPLILHGHVYLACPPLYKIEYGKKNKYIWSEDEMKEITKKIDCKFSITRYKGLGEMDFDELGETTLNRENRRLIRVNVPDIGDADHMLSLLMGKNVSVRKEHIIKRSIEVAEEVNLYI
jgi:DNA gyrase subunit B